MEKKVYIVMSAGTMEWRIDGIYDSMEQVLKKFQDDWDIPELTMDEIEDCDWLNENEIRIKTGSYFQRDDNINEIIK